MPPDHSPDVPSVQFKIRNGAITESKLHVGDQISFGDSLVGRKVHEISDWWSALPQLEETKAASRRERAIAWLRQMLPNFHSHQG